jgi:hypothetical protein
VQTVEQNKISLSSFDDRRYICENNIDTLTYGHKNISHSFYAVCDSDAHEMQEDLWGGASSSQTKVEKLVPECSVAESSLPSWNAYDSESDAVQSITGDSDSDSTE